MEHLTNRQAQAVFSLLSTDSVAQASERCGIPERTLYRWLQDPSFKAAFERGASEMFEDAMRYLRKSSLEAAHELVRLSKSQKVPTNLGGHPKPAIGGHLKTGQ